MPATGAPDSTPTTVPVTDALHAVIASSSVAGPAGTTALPAAVPVAAVALHW